MKSKSIASLVLTLVVVVIGAVALASGGSAKNRQAQAASGTVVSVRHTSLGQTLVDGRGRTLYLFEADRHSVSTLSAAGRAIWPPYKVVGKVKAGGGAKAAQLGTTTGHGIKQVTYNGHPLYYYIGDRAPGNVRGQGLNQFGALWYVLSPSGSAVTGAARTTTAPSNPQPTPTQPTPAAPTYNYGY